ncbi:PhnD/SsuA/transferrin family substrate-binding protein [Candidatus Margulisiibacteriota bacterium]
MKKILLIFFFIFTIFSSSATALQVHFFVPEANIHDYALLKNIFGNYLANFGEYDFQPYSSQTVFEKAIKSEKKGLFIMSSWLYNKLNTNNNLVVKLVMESSKRNTTKEMLTTRKDRTLENLLSGGTLATSRSKLFVRKILKELFPNKNVSKVKIISVPRDLDALISVSYGMAIAAITSKDNFFKMKKIDPLSYKKLKSLAESNEMLRPIVVVYRNQELTYQPLYQVLLKMDKDNKSETLLDLIDFSRWKIIKNKDKKYLSI